MSSTRPSPIEVRFVVLVLLVAGGCSSDPPVEAAESSTSGTSEAGLIETTSNAPAQDGSTSHLDSTSATTTASTETSGDPPPDNPRLPGPHGWLPGTHVLDLGLEANVTLTLYIPDEDGPHPVVVLTHGFQLAPADYASYGEHLASWGFIVVMPAFPGSLLEAPTHAELGSAMVALLDWIDDVDGMVDGPLIGRGDAESLGLAGHSMGGKIAFLTASSDPRIDAVFGIDPVDTAGGPGSSPGPDSPSVTPELMPAITVPIVALGETTNATSPLGPACAPADENFQQYFQHAVSPALEIEVLGANHMSFLDDPNCGIACSVCPTGTDDPAVTRERTLGYITAFFGLTLRGEPVWIEWLTGEPMQTDVEVGLVSFNTANDF